MVDEDSTHVSIIFGPASHNTVLGVHPDRRRAIKHANDVGQFPEDFPYVDRQTIAAHSLGVEPTVVVYPISADVGQDVYFVLDCRANDIGDEEMDGFNQPQDAEDHASSLGSYKYSSEIERDERIPDAVIYSISMDSEERLWTIVWEKSGASRRARREEIAL